MMDYKRYLFEQDVEELHRNFDYLSDFYHNASLASRGIK